MSRARGVLAALFGLALIGVVYVAPEGSSPRQLSDIVFSPLISEIDGEEFDSTSHAAVTAVAGSSKAELLHGVLSFALATLPEWAKARELEGSVLTHLTPKVPSVFDDLVALVREHTLTGEPDDSKTPKYFGFIPKHMGRVYPSKPEVELGAGRCWDKISAAVTKTKSNDYEISMKVSGHLHFICTEVILFATASGFNLGVFPTPIPGTKTYTFKTEKLSASEIWDIENNGIRVNRFREDVTELMRDLLHTALLFVPELTASVPEFAAKRNIEFLKEYRGIDMQPRKDDATFVLNETEIHSGDFLGIIRLDGLDPMLAWGMGSHTGHTVITVWEGGQLYVCESTAKGSYWPTNGIQRTPYRQWLTQARKAGFNVVHLPLTMEYRELFAKNIDNAWSFFRANENLNYGYHTLLHGWIDDTQGNYPCLPPYNKEAPFSDEDAFCLTGEIVEILFPLVGKLVPAAGVVFEEVWNGIVTGDTFAGKSATELYQIAAKKGMKPKEIPAVPLTDNTLYSQVYNNGTKTKAPDMVCNVFVCSMWKAAGFFEGKEPINCVETMNEDVYEMNVVAPMAQRPAACVAQDPHSSLCQLMGDWQMDLGHVGFRPIAPHYADKCVGKAPDYARPIGC